MSLVDDDHGPAPAGRIRFRVHPPRHRAAQAVVDRLVAAYDERVDLILSDLEDVIRHADSRGSSGDMLIAVEKAVRTPFRPGSRGGKWYRDAKGNVRYGQPPEGRFMGNAPDSPPPAPHVDHFRPRPFMGAYDNDRDLTDFLVEHGGSHGFSQGELRFLEAWYGTRESGGSLFEAFLECAGITREDLKSGSAGLRFGTQQMTYEEAVFEFFAAQGELFMGEDPTSPDAIEEWHKILNDEIRPLIDGVFSKYENVKDDPDIQRLFAEAPARQRRRFYDAARRTADGTSGVADAITSEPDPRRQVDVVIAGMREMGLLSRQSRAEHHAYVHGRPHLRDAVSVDRRLFGDPDSPLLGDPDKLSTLTSSQLMMVFAAAELHRRWDPHSRTFSTESQAGAGEGDLAAAALGALAEKTPGWADAAVAIRGHLEGAVDRLVSKLNRINSREGLPTKHGPVRPRPRSRR